MPKTSIMQKECIDALAKDPKPGMLGPSASCCFDGLVVVCCNRITETNQQFADLIGYTQEELVGLEVAQVLHSELITTQSGQAGSEEWTENDTKLLHKSGHWVLVDARKSELTFSGQAVHVLAVRAVQPLDQRSAIMAARLRLMEKAQDCSIEELLVATLDEAELLTKSKVGFYHFVDEDSQALTLQAWSTATTLTYCQANAKGHNYPISKAGIWVQPCLTREPFICNDYAAYKGKCGLPEGHAEVVRFLVAPILRAGKVVALLGVGNKSTEYLQQDADVIAGLADLAWDIVGMHRAQSQLRESEERLRLATAATSDAVWDWNILRDELYFSDRCCALLGYSREELAPQFKTWQQLIHPDDIGSTLLMLEQHLKGLAPYDIEFRLKHKTGEYLWIRARGQAQNDANGQAVRVVGTLEDVTKERLAAHELALQKEKYQSFISNSHEAVYCTEFDQPIDTTLPVEEQIDEIYRHAYMGECNAAMARMYGMESPEEFRGKRMVDVHGGSDNPINRASWGRFIESGYQIHDIETEEFAPDGSAMHFVSNDVGIIENGRLVRIWGSATNVTASKQAEEALRESEQKFRGVFEQSLLGVALIDTKTGRFKQINPKYSEILGRNREDLLGMDSQSLTHPDDLDADLKRMDLLKEGKIRQFHLEKRYVRPDGSLVWVQLTVVPMWEPGGAPCCHLAMVEDIGDRRQFVSALAQERDRAKLILDTIPAIVVALDHDGIVTEVNEAACELLGYQSAEMVGKNWFDHFLPAASNGSGDVREAIARIMAGELEPVRYYENQISTKDGQCRLIAWQNSVVLSDSGDIVGTLSAGNDITEKREIEVALSKRERDFRDLFETMSEGIVSTEVTDVSRFVLANPAAERLLGVAPGGLIGRRHAEFCDAEGMNIIEEQWKLRQEGQTTTYEMPLVRADGERRVIRVTASPVTYHEGQVTGSYSLLQDVTESRAAESKLREHVAFLEAIDHIDSVMRRAESYDEMIMGTLTRMREEFGCSRAWLLHPLDPEASHYAIPWEITAAEYPGANAEGALVPIDPETADLFEACLSHEGALEFGPGAELTVPQVVIERFSVQSQLLLAVYPRSGSPWLLGMHQCDQARVWSEHEKRLLKEIGSRLTDGLSAQIALEKLREGEEKYRQLVETVNAVPWQFDLLADKWTYVAPQVEALLGFKPEDFTNLQWWVEHIHEEDRCWAPEYCREKTLAGKDHVFDYRFVSKDGRVVWIHDIVHVVMSADGPVALAGYMVDVSEAKELERALEHETELLNGLMEAIPDTVYIKDEQSRFLRINRAQADLLGASNPLEAIGRTDADFYPPEEAEWRRQDELRIMRTGQAQLGVLEELPSGNGRPRWISATKLPMYDAEGKVVGTYGISRDVSQLVEAQLRLQEHEDRYTALINTSQEGFWVVDINGTIVEVNDTYCSMFGYTRDEVIGQHVSRFEAIEDEEAVRKHMADILVSGWAHFDTRHLHSDGRQVDVAVSTTVFGPSKRFLAFFRDITESKRAAEQLAWSEERYRSFVSRSSEGIWCFEVDEPVPVDVPAEEQVRLCFERGYLSECNDAYAHMYGLSDATQMKGARLTDLMPPSDPRNVEYMRAAVEARYSIRDARSYELDAEGREHVILNNMVGVIEDSQLVRAWGMQRDITEQVEAEKALRESERRWQFALEGSGAGVWDWDFKSDHLYLSRQCRSMLGYNEQDPDIPIPEWSDLVHSDDLPRASEALDAHLAGLTDGYQSEIRLRCKDGSYKWILDRGKIIEWDENGKPMRVIGTHTDVSEMKATEQNLKDYVGWLEQAEEVGKFATWDWNRDTGEVRWSKHYFDLLGYGMREVTPSVELFDHHLHPDDVADVARIRAEAVAANTTPRIRHRIVTVQGDVLWVEESAAEVTDSAGNQRLLGITRDITEEVLAEQALSQERESAQRILDTVETIIVAMDAEGKVTDINRHACQVLGYEASALIGKDWFEFCLPQPEGLQAVKDVFFKIIQGSADPVDYFENEVLTRDGQRRMVAWRNTFTRDSSGAYIGVLSAGQDITDRIIARRALQASEDKYRRLVEMAAEGIIALNPDGTVNFANARMLEILGCEAHQIVGHSITKFMFASDVPVLEDKIAERREGKSGSYEQRYRRADGSEVWCLISGSPVFEEGRFVGSFAMVTDITERRRVEAELLQAQKSEALGTMLGGIAHDFNNLLFGILGSGELVLDALAPNTQVFEDMRMLMAAGGRAKDLVQQLLAFSRTSSAKAELSDARRIVSETLALLRRAIPSYIEIVADLGDEVVQIKANATQLQQVIMNLCMNSVQAMEPMPGTLRVSVSKAIPETNQSSEEEAADGQGEVVICIQDTGAGISANILGRIFDPYFTTKSKGRGTGLGLSVVQGILKQIGGTIEVASEVGKGTQVTVRLPLYLEDVEVVESVERQEDSLRARVLIVDDEPDLVVIIQRMLERVGCSATCCSGPMEALSMVSKSISHFDLVLTDFSMPVLTGLQLAERLSETAPNLPIIIYSGNPAELVLERLKLPNVKLVLQKPISRAALLEGIRSGLGLSEAAAEEKGLWAEQ